MSKRPSTALRNRPEVTKKPASTLSFSTNNVKQIKEAQLDMFSFRERDTIDKEHLQATIATIERRSCFSND